MPFERLDNLVKIGQLKAESPARAEFDGLVRSAVSRIKDAENESLSIESRFDLAYNAAHAFALAALRYHGYRSENRFMVFQALQDTVNLPAAQWRVLDQAHKKRNLTEYEGNVDVDAKLVGAVIRVAREVEKRLSVIDPLSD